MSSRALILDNIRQSLNISESGKARESRVDARLKAQKNNIVPKMPKRGAPLVRRFIEKAKAAQASIVKVPRAKVAGEISKFLRGHNLPQELRMGDDPRLEKLIGKRKSLKLSHGAADKNDVASLSHADAGIGETGTLMLLSGKDNPTTLNFLPENQIVIVEESDIVASYEDYWEKLRSNIKSNAIPRNINMITGPSRSADIEQTLILGAHGPVRLHIILVQK